MWAEPEVDFLEPGQMNRPPPPPPPALPPSGTAAPPAAPGGGVNTQLLGNLIRHWVHHNSILNELNRQIREARSARKEYEDQVLKILRAANMTNPVIQIGGGERLIVANERHTQPLSLRNLEELLTQYYKQKPGSRDETKEILKHIRAQRESETVQVLRKQNAPSSRAKD